MKYPNENIVAVASGNVAAGIGVVRISGFNLIDIISKLTKKDISKPRYAHYVDFFDADNSIIDSGLLLYFVAPNSFTGEDVVELQGHGNPIVLNMLVKRCVELGCRLAEAGEFTKRAYLNGKLDLVQAESVADLIHAQSESSAKGALRSLKGAFSGHIRQIHDRMVDLRMFVEATLDFPEEDIEFIASAKIKDKLQVLRDEIYQLLNSTKQGVLLNHGANIVIIGQPNVGKSSLLNALANEEVAIVTNIAGTTRDTIKEKIIIDGVPFNIIDTAGIRETQDVVEKIGIERALSAMQNADLCMVLIDDRVGLSNVELDILAQLNASTPRIFVHNKIDLSNKQVSVNQDENGLNIYISAAKNLGIDELRHELLKMVGWQSNQTDTFIARERHLANMRSTVEHIDNAFIYWSELEILAGELRYAHNELSQITGEFSADDLLGEIFSRFCIGK